MIPIPTLIIGVAIEWPIAHEAVGGDVIWDLGMKGWGDEEWGDEEGGDEEWGSEALR